MTADRPEGPAQPDDFAHLTRFIQECDLWPETARFKAALTLLFEAIGIRPGLEIAAAFPNEVASLACFGRAFHQLRAAWTLLGHGHNLESRATLRGVYESAGLGRYFAKEPAEASRWLSEGGWWPDKKVRSWLSSLASGGNRQQVENFTAYYREASALSHPTSRACMPTLGMDAERLWVETSIAFDENESRIGVAIASDLALFACFALVNASAGEIVFAPKWRQTLTDLLREVSADPLAHLDRDWDVEQQRHVEFWRRLRDAKDLDAVLDDDPMSTRNLKNAIYRAPDQT